MLPSHVLSDIVTGVNNAVSGSPRHDYSEFTMEVNPEDIVEKGDDYVKSLLDLGVNRISMGVQSFDDDVLRWMNRRHDAEHAEQAYWMLRSNGFRNLLLYIMYPLSARSSPPALSHGFLPHAPPPLKPRLPHSGRTFRTHHPPVSVPCILESLRNRNCNKCRNFCRMGYVCKSKLYN